MRTPDEVIESLLHNVGDAELEAATRERFVSDLKHGQFEYETLPGFTRSRVCPKCGNARVKVHYHNGDNPACFRESGGMEHLLRACAGNAGCGYSWNEKCLSTEEYPAHAVPHGSSNFLERLLDRLFRTQRAR